MKTNLEEDTRYEYKVKGDTPWIQTLKANHAIKTSFEGDTRHENELWRRHTPWKQT